MSPSDQPTNQTPGHAWLSESPWFWVLLFAVAALAALLVIGPKYARRQARLEQRYENRLQVELSQGQLEQDPSDHQANPRAMNGPGRSAGSLLPLILLVCGVIAVSSAGLYRSWRAATEHSDS